MTIFCVIVEVIDMDKKLSNWVELSDVNPV